MPDPADWPLPIAARLAPGADRADVYDALWHYAAESLEGWACATRPAAELAAQELAERLAASAAVDAIVADLLALSGSQRDGLGWLLEETVAAVAGEIRAARLRVSIADELPAAPPGLRAADALADVDTAALRATAGATRSVAPGFAGEAEQLACGAETAGIWRELRRAERRRERGRPPSPLRRIAAAVDACFASSMTRGERDRLAAALARDVLGAASTPETVRHLMAIHRRGSQK